LLISVQRILIIGVLGDFDLEELAESESCHLQSPTVIHETVAAFQTSMVTQGTFVQIIHALSKASIGNAFKTQTEYSSHNCFKNARIVSG
jgi:hypothetical protein